MNYQKTYDLIIQKAKSENRKKETYYKIKKYNLEQPYYENHHIIPKCLNGTNNKENLVLLTAKEHYVCHKLLMYIHSNNRGIILSFIRMLYNKKSKNPISSRDYEFAKKTLSKQMTGRKLSEEHRKNIGIGVKGKMKGIPKSCEAKIKMKESRLKFLKENINPLLGRKRPEFAEKQKGKNNPIHRMSNENKNKWKKSLSKSGKGKTHNLKEILCPYCNLKGKGPNMSRWHGDNCKFKPI
jgi:hypothetical protein